MPYISHMTSHIGTLEIVGAALFAMAVLHTFSTRYFEYLAHTKTAHSGLWHLLGEVETVFGFWAFVLLVFMALAYGWGTASIYLDNRRFVEPMFVFVIMVIAASRPIMQLATDSVRSAGRLLPVQPAIAGYFLSLSFVPLLGSLITEPAAMTLAALMLRDRIFVSGASSRLKYATLGVLFVNISVGGTLTNFANKGQRSSARHVDENTFTGSNGRIRRPTHSGKILRNGRRKGTACKCVDQRTFRRVWNDVV